LATFAEFYHVLIVGVNITDWSMGLNWNKGIWFHQSLKRSCKVYYICLIIMAFLCWKAVLI